LPFAFLLSTYLKVSLAGVVTAVAVDLYGVLCALAMNATELLALIDGACTGGVLALVGGARGVVRHGLVGHLLSPSCGLVRLKKATRFYAKSRGESREEAFSVQHSAFSLKHFAAFSPSLPLSEARKPERFG
jgi:hypothetical protein